MKQKISVRYVKVIEIHPASTKLLIRIVEVKVRIDAVAIKDVKKCFGWGESEGEISVKRDMERFVQTWRNEEWK